MKKIMFCILFFLFCSITECWAGMYESFHFHFSTDRSPDNVYSYDARIAYNRGENFNTFARGLLIIPSAENHNIRFVEDAPQIQNAYFDSFDELSATFPPGDYAILLKGEKSTAKFTFTHKEIEFPVRPEIYYPTDYQENVELNLVVNFKTLPDNISGASATVWDDEGNMIVDSELTGGADSIEISGLQPSSWYTVEIRSHISGHYFSGYQVRFMTREE